MTEHAAPATESSQATFADLGLSESVLACVRKAGFVKPTPIQEKTIPIALAGRDVIGLAQTGSGKTAAFVLPLAERLTHGQGLRGLILCPTREIALQTKDFLDKFGHDHKLVTACLIGGMRMGGQIQALKKEPDIIVATPGRLYDHVQRRTLKLDKVEELVLDEADHMLDMGFLPQIQRILKLLPKKRRTMMFSATMPEAIGRLAKQFLTDPIRVDIIPPGKAAVNLSHELYLIDWEYKQDCLVSLVKHRDDSTLVFTRTKSDADFVAKILQNKGFNAFVIHSDLSQRQRIEALAALRDGTCRILVATDIASRGIDIPAIRHIVNYDVPENPEDYIHRAGRTARADAVGIVSTIGIWQDKMHIRAIEAALGKELPRCTAPGIKPYVEFKLDPRHRMGGRRR